MAFRIHARRVQGSNLPAVPRASARLGQRRGRRRKLQEELAELAPRNPPGKSKENWGCAICRVISRGSQSRSRNCAQTHQRQITRGSRDGAPSPCLGPGTG